ncbi:VOC family protein [Listeria monocytogenes]|nr:VOC family protein [Listeria monocytogenes]
MFNQAKRISTFFTFNGNGEEAFNFYLDTFPDAKKVGLTYFTKPEQGGDIGKVLNATFEMKGVSFMIMDMTNNASPDFSWATTTLYFADTEDEFDTLFEKLAKEGTVMMGPEAVEALRKVAWVTDKYGITWQLAFV